LQPYACDLCPARFPSNPYLFQHKRDVHEKRTYQCAICGKVNKYYVNHSIHMRKHRQDAAEAEASKDLPFPLPPESKTCPQCGKQFVHARRLRSHMNNVHGELQQHGTSASASALSRSRPEARAAGVFTCDACPKIFSTFNALKRHKLVEHPANGVKPVFFQCKLCERGFGLVSTIRSHLRKTHVAHLWPSELLQQNSVTVTAPAGDMPEKTYSLETYFIRNKWSSFK
jgi:Zinc finger, C2H2 type